jgi:hypothetical protein
MKDCPMNNKLFQAASVVVGVVALPVLLVVGNTGNYLRRKRKSRKEARPGRDT